LRGGTNTIAALAFEKAKLSPPTCSRNTTPPNVRYFGRHNGEVYYIQDLGNNKYKVTNMTLSRKEITGYVTTLPTLTWDEVEVKKPPPEVKTETITKVINTETSTPSGGNITITTPTPAPTPRNLGDLYKLITPASTQVYKGKVVPKLRYVSVRRLTIGQVNRYVASGYTVTEAADDAKPYPNTPYPPSVIARAKVVGTDSVPEASTPRSSRRRGIQNRVRGSERKVFQPLERGRWSSSTRRTTF